MQSSMQGSPQTNPEHRPLLGLPTLAYNPLLVQAAWGPSTAHASGWMNGFYSRIN